MPPLVTDVAAQSDYDYGGLHDGVDEREYRIRTATGLTVASAYFGDLESSNPSAAQLREGHQLAFGTTYKDAGRYRRALPVEGPGAEAAQIDQELELLRAQMGEMLTQATTPQAKAAAVAFHHARLSSISPFRRGNERLARSLLTMQIERELGAFGGPMMDSILRDPGTYGRALRTARKENDLAPLTGLLCRNAGISEPEALSIPSPFRVMPDGAAVPTSAIKLERSRTGEPMPLASSPEMDGLGIG